MKIEEMKKILNYLKTDKGEDTAIDVIVEAMTAAEAYPQGYYIAVVIGPELSITATNGMDNSSFLISVQEGKMLQVASCPASGQDAEDTIEAEDWSQWAAEEADRKLSDFLRELGDDIQYAENVANYR